MNHINVGADFVKNLVENANWQKAGLEVSVKETEEETKEASIEEEAAPVEEVKAEEEEEELEEETKEHQCPLCESVLEEELSEEKLISHLGAMQELFAKFTAKEEDEEAFLKEFEDEEAKAVS